MSSNHKIQRDDHEAPARAEVEIEVERTEFRRNTSSGELRKPIRPFHSGDWWLNVNYVENESLSEEEFLAFMRRKRH